MKRDKHSRVETRDTSKEERTLKGAREAGRETSKAEGRQEKLKKDKRNWETSKAEGRQEMLKGDKRS